MNLHKQLKQFQEELKEHEVAMDTLQKVANDVESQIRNSWPPDSREATALMKLVENNHLTFKVIITYYDLQQKRRLVYGGTDLIWGKHEEHKVDSEVELLKKKYLGINAECPKQRNSIRKEYLFFEPELLKK